MTETAPQGYGPVHRTSTGFGLHHVQVSIPEGGEAEAQAFYVDVLGMIEIPKPPVLAARGGLWVRADHVELHLGVEKDFRPARKAHPGIVVRELDSLAERISSQGHDVEWDDNFPGHRRFYAHDTHGNRLEFLQREFDPKQSCWCCGTRRDASEMVHLGNHPEVALCTACARWAANQAWALEDASKSGPFVTARGSLRRARSVVVERGLHRNPVIGPAIRWLGRRLP